MHGQAKHHAKNTNGILCLKSHLYLNVYYYSGLLTLYIHV